MVLGGQAKRIDLIGAVEIRQLVGRRVVGEEVARHVLPPEVLEAAHADDLETRVDGETVLPGETAETEGVVAATHHPVVVEVEAGGHAGVGVGRVAIGVVDAVGHAAHRVAVAGGQEVVLEEAGGGARIAERHGCAAGTRRAVQVEVELVDQQHVGRDALDDLGHVVGLPDAAAAAQRVGEVDQQVAAGVAVERSVEGREAHRVGRHRGRGDDAGAEADEQGFEPEVHDRASRLSVCCDGLRSARSCQGRQAASRSRAVPVPPRP